MGKTYYKPEIVDEIINRIAGGETLSSILKDENMPTRVTVWNWQQDYPEFKARYRDARYEQMHKWADDMIDFADNAQMDFLRDGDGNPVFKNGDGATPIFITYGVKRTQQMIHTRQWLMERINKDDYGPYQKIDLQSQIEEKDNDELLHDLRQAFQEIGLGPEEVVALVFGDDATIH